MKIVIFGATSAIAQATARLWAKDGHDLILVARNQNHLGIIAADLRVFGAASVTEILCDLDQIEGHKKLLDTVISQHKSIDIAFIAYGLLGDNESAQSNFAETMTIFHTNFISASSLIHHLANYFESQGHGSLAAISSVAGDRGRKSNYIYGTSKGALSIFLQGIRNRLATKGVHVLTIKPGFVDTPMTAHITKKPFVASPEQVAQDIVKAIATHKDILYTPKKWAIIMFIIRTIPECIFKRMSL